MDAFTSRVYLLRHGEIATPGILCGHVDVALSDVGYEQMRLASAKLSRFDAIYSSPLKRCSTHAEFLARQHTINVQYNNALKEFNFGDWDGQDYQQLWQQNGKLHVGDFWQHPWQVKVPNGELMADFYARVEAWWQAFLVSLTESKHTQSLVISHAGVIKQILAIICHMPKQTNTHLNVFHLPYAGLITLDVYIDEQGQAWPKIVF
ncbi:histidine phosphatase family protein [Pseudoalteromonas lipolytica]|uniref:histidine phosphatase family protein n=1 Tax=Pseudoalteromonas lipolytica TaxID=570156 RepID=UPI0008263C5F|nr:histidine phosphatase family protein [Pseudoalteromonas lipolytica]